MDDNRRYEAFVRNRITELREQKGVSEHRMSLELGKSGSYIRSITNGISMPSLRELFNIMEYFDLTPTLFFAPMDDPDSLRGIISGYFPPTRPIAPVSDPSPGEEDIPPDKAAGPPPE